MAKLSFQVPSAPSTPLDVARAYIAAGVPVFPCREEAQEEIDQATGEVTEYKEKAPYTTNGLKGATASRRIVDIWFGDRYPSAVIGLPTGETLGGWVLDLDRHGDRDGHEWLAEMEAVHGALPPTARATTANGGTHIFFKHVEGIRNKAAIAPGVDTRGTGGYIIAPGSLMADGRAYKWVNHDGLGMPEFAEAPQWLLDLLLAKQPERPAERHEYTYAPARADTSAYDDAAISAELSAVASAPKGQRGHQLFSSACRIGEFVAAGVLSRADAEAQLYSAASACGVAREDGERETMSRIRRGLDKTAGSPRQAPEPTYANDNTPPVDTSKLLAKARAAPEMASNPEPAPPKQRKPRERFELTWFDEIEEGVRKEHLIKGVLGVGEFSTVSGLPGTGKSVIVTDAACHVSAGMEWHGRRIKQGLVVYVAAERKKLTERRMMAFRKRHGVKDVPLLVLGGKLDFTRNTDDAKALVNVIKDAEEQTGLACVWVIVDTLTRVFGGGDQNASKDMTKFVQSCDEILAETSAHVTVIHHSAWSGERGKGAIDLDGAVDSSFMVKKASGKYVLDCNGTNDGEEGVIVTFQMESVTLGTDEDGEPTTAPVVVPVADAQKLSSGTLRGYKGEALKALSTAIEKHGIEPEGDAFPEGVLVVDEQTWRAEFYATRDTSTTAGAETAKKQFQRAPSALVEANHVNNVGLWYWPA